MKVEEAIKKLNEVGLVAEFVGDSDQRIIGGTERVNELGFNVYSNSFAIYREGDSWLVVVTDLGQLDTTKQTATLTEAINQTCQLYEAQYCSDNRKLVVERAESREQGARSRERREL